MAFFTTTITTLKTVVTALGAGVAVWGVVNISANLSKKCLKNML